MAKRHTAVVVGMGERGKIHLYGLLNNPGSFEVAGVCDRHPDRLEAGADEYSIPKEKRFTDAEAMMAAVKPDILAFATMPHIRVPLVELAVKYRVKGLLFEKPLAISLNEAAEIVRLCHKNNIKAAVCHQHKYLRSYDQMREALESGELGEIYEIRASCKPNPSMLGTHYIDYMIWANGGSRVKAVAGHVHGNFFLDYHHPSPDYFLAQLAFENGVRGIIECGYFSPQRADYHTGFTYNPDNINYWTDDRLTVLGTRGYAWAECSGRCACFTGRTAPEIAAGDYGDFVKREQFEAQIRYTADYARWLDGKAEFSCNLDTAYHGFEILEAIYRSALYMTRIDLPLATAEEDTLALLRQKLNSVAYRKF
ncbi:MAG: Gfo/Idh/MocA family oxidoreductase [Treponema sp.]|jgi:predicted dehydrogenase|nr:Gfo/Idh/MocA family oxidoreductase [Treponema sp.]